MAILPKKLPITSNYPKSQRPEFSDGLSDAVAEGDFGSPAE